MTSASVTSRPADLLALALDVAREAAALVREARAGTVEVTATKSSAVDVVTDTDRASEALIRERILAARPDDSFLGEEGGRSTDGSSGIRWVVDPIDGTVNFLYGIPHYAVSIAAERLDSDGSGRAEVIVGVVLDVASGTEYAARAGGGATRDGRPIGVRPEVPLAERLVLTGFSYSAEVRAVQAAAVARMLPRVRDIRRLGSCALDLCRVAEGGADAYVEEGVQVWDHAAAGLVAREAGARVELSRGATGRDVVIAAPEAGFAAFRTLAVASGFLA
ncbi:inositol monophosphatase family protein [Nocardioides jiangxiensis]|uniref:Inositol-1-monophosphatase n=1 Tax=Nocardioides jiangxiensis TaxID=3064524 RepID=A0ABT9B3W5_9ACTN|nr:inositol monophosphatase family protein [Nocardioides sp. WY-20]MDO7869470.1 inositol monophosphatase family protein [Nocardioides sp. WY-20]